MAQVMAWHQTGNKQPLPETLTAKLCSAIWWVPLGPNELNLIIILMNYIWDIMKAAEVGVSVYD